LVLLVAACFLALVGFLRELGYAATAYLSGGSILGFPVNLFGPGQRATVAGDFSPLQLSLQAVARIALPLLAWLLFILLVPQEASLPLELGKLFSSAFILVLQLPWVGIPVLAMIGRAPAQSDPAIFLANSGLPPAGLTAATLLLLALTAWLTESRLAYWRSTWTAFKSTTAATQGRHRRLLSIFAFLTVASVTLAFSINAAAHLENGILPLGFHRAAALDLQGQVHEAQSLYTFHVDSAGTFNLILVIQGAGPQSMAVELDGPEDSSWTVVDADQTTAAYQHVGFREFLYPGDYNLLLTAPPAPGSITVYARGPS
jgi:hypothetical protein